MAQGLANICNPKYKPKASDHHEKEMFQEQQDFVYSVLLKSLLTHYGKPLVREHEIDRDAQSILAKLHQDHTNSEFSRCEIMRLTKYITNLKLDESWRCTIMLFIMHFKEQLHLLNSLVTPKAMLPDTARLTFLHTAVESVSDQHHSQIVDGVMRTKPCTTMPMSYEYFELLHDAAFHHDRAFKTTNKSRQANVHALEQPEPVQFHEVDSTPVHTYDIFMNSVIPPIPKELVKVFDRIPTKGVGNIVMTVQSEQRSSMGNRISDATTVRVLGRTWYSYQY